MKHVVLAAVGDSRVAFDLGRVSHVLWDGRVTALPGAPSYIQGVLAYRQHLVGVVDLARHLKRKSDGSGKHIFLVHGDGMMLGVRVDRVLGVFPAGSVTGGDTLLIEPDAILSEKAKRVLHGLY